MGKPMHIMVFIWLSCTLVCAIQIDKDSVNLTDSTAFIILFNNSNGPVYLDSVHIVFKIRDEFKGGQFLFDTGSYKSMYKKMYGDLSYPILWRDNSATAVSLFSAKLLLPSKSDLKIYNIRLGSCWGCAGFKKTYSSLTDTVKLVFTSSDKSKDSVQAIVTLLYGSKTIREKNKLRPSTQDRIVKAYRIGFLKDMADLNPGAVYGLNGAKINRRMAIDQNGLVIYK